MDARRCGCPEQCGTKRLKKSRLDSDALLREASVSPSQRAKWLHQLERAWRMAVTSEGIVAASASVWGGSFNSRSVALVIGPMETRRICSGIGSPVACKRSTKFVAVDELVKVMTSGASKGFCRLCSSKTIESVARTLR